MIEWDKLFASFSTYYYSYVLMFLIELITLVIAIKYGRKSKIGFAFLLYISFDFFVFLLGRVIAFHTNVPKEFTGTYVNTSNAIISLVELLVYYYFFSEILLNKKINMIMRMFGLIYFALIIIYSTTKFEFLTDRTTYVSHLLGTIEFLFLIPPCLVYFHNLLNNNSEIPLLERPSFWIVTGIFFFALISIPFYLMSIYLKNDINNIWFKLSAALFYIPFTINFCCLIKAFLCKRTLTI